MAQQQGVPYIGSHISLVTNSELRYEGILASVDTAESTVTLKDVHMKGTENRGINYVPPSPEIYGFVSFNGKDIKDLTVMETAITPKHDPAIVALGSTIPPNSDIPSARASGGQSQGNYNNYNGYDNQRPRRLAQRGRGSAPTSGPRGVVGELAAQPNNSLKTQVAEEFDFDTANSKFDRSDKATPAEGSDDPKGYSKETSFFDNISCEALESKNGTNRRVDRDRQRELDTQTFGPMAARPRYRRGGMRRGIGMRGGFGARSYYGSSVVQSGYYQPAY